MQAKLWRAHSIGLYGIETVHTDDVPALAYSPTNTVDLASGSDGRTVRLWNTESECLRGSLQGHTNSTMVIAYSLGGSFVASGSKTQTVCLWDIASGTSLRELQEHDDFMRAGSFSPDGRLATSGSWDHPTRVWNVSTGEPVCPPLVGHTDRVCCVTFSPDSKRVVSGSHDQTIRVWDVGTATTVMGTLYGHTDRVTVVRFHPDGKTLVSGSLDETCRMWDMEPDRTRALLGIGSMRIGFGPSHLHLTAKSWPLAQTVSLLDVHMGSAGLPPWEAHKGCVRSVSFAANGERLVSGGDDGAVRIWHIGSGECVYEASIGANGVRSVAFSPDDRHVAPGLWFRGRCREDPRQPSAGGVCPRRIQRTRRLGHIAGLFPRWEGRRFWLCGLDDPRLGRRARRGSPPVQRARRRGALCRLHPRREAHRVWLGGHRDPHLGREVWRPPLRGHSKPVLFIALSPDVLVSCSQDNSIRTWDPVLVSTRRTYSPCSSLPTGRACRPDPRLRTASCPCGARSEAAGRRSRTTSDFRLHTPPRRGR